MDQGKKSLKTRIIWEVGVLLIVFALLFLIVFYFGVFNAKGDSFYNSLINQPLYLARINIDNINGIQMDLRNDAETNVFIENIVITGCGNSQYINGSLELNQTKRFSIVCNPPLIKGTHFRGEINLTYYKENSAILFSVSGYINSGVASA
jgi:hypothetical protein